MSGLKTGGRVRVRTGFYSAGTRRASFEGREGRVIGIDGWLNHATVQFPPGPGEQYDKSIALALASLEPLQ